MAWKIKKSGEPVGQIDFVHGMPQIANGSQELTSIIHKALNGVSLLQDFYNSESESFTLEETQIKPDHELFPMALKRFLESNGYEVAEEHSDVENKIQAILGSFPDGNEDKNDILTRLPDMSHLEQTLLLRELSKLEKE